MKLILHVGPHKTGTTSIQKALHAERGRLQKDGILYPPSIANAHFAEQHSDLAFLLQRGDVEQIWAWLAESLQAATQARCHFVLISGEEFSRFVDDQSFTTLVRELRARHHVELVYVSRSSSEVIKSSIMEQAFGDICALTRYANIDSMIESTYQFIQKQQAYFRSLGANIVEFDELKKNAALTRSFVFNTIGKDLSYLADRHDNRITQKLSNPLYFLSVPLRIMFAIQHGIPANSPKCVHSVMDLLSESSIDIERITPFLSSFERFLDAQIQLVIGKVDKQCGSV